MHREVGNFFRNRCSCAPGSERQASGRRYDVGTPGRDRETESAKDASNFFFSDFFTENAFRFRAPKGDFGRRNAPGDDVNFFSINCAARRIQNELCNPRAG